MEYPVSEKEMFNKFKESVADVHITIDERRYINLLTALLNQAYAIGVRDGMKL